MNFGVVVGKQILIRKLLGQVSVYGISEDGELTDKTEMHRTFWSKNLEEKDHLEDLGLGGEY